MYAKQTTLANTTGLHLRPATLFVETASRFRSRVRVRKDSTAADGKSAIGLMLLEAACGEHLIVEASGEDEIAAVDALVALIESRFGERIES